MNRYIKYNKYYRLAILCLAIALTTTIGIIVVAAVSFTSPIAMMTIFFVPTIIGVTLMLGIKFWYDGEDRRLGLYTPDETERR